jgi:hypothetical protein
LEDAPAEAGRSFHPGRVAAVKADIVHPKYRCDKCGYIHFFHLSCCDHRVYLNEDETVKVLVWNDGTVEYCEAIGRIWGGGIAWSKPQTLWEQKP